MIKDGEMLLSNDRGGNIGCCCFKVSTDWLVLLCFACIVNECLHVLHEKECLILLQ